MTTNTKPTEDQLVEALSKSFRCFGGGQLTPGNPISHALQHTPPSFAAGVDVREVVRHILATIKYDG